MAARTDRCLELLRDPRIARPDLRHVRIMLRDRA
jgi:hypothetical protein